MSHARTNTGVRVTRSHLTSFDTHKIFAGSFLFPPIEESRILSQTFPGQIKNPHFKRVYMFLYCIVSKYNIGLFIVCLLIVYENTLNVLSMFLSITFFTESISVSQAFCCVSTCCKSICNLFSFIWIAAVLLLYSASAAASSAVL